MSCALSNAHQLFFLVIRSATPQWIVEIRDNQDGFDGVVLDGESQSVQADAITLVGGDFECAQPMHFKALQRAKVHRRFNCDDIAWFAYGEQAQVDSLNAARCDDNVIGGELTTIAQRAFGNLYPQILQSRWEFVAVRVCARLAGQA